MGLADRQSIRSQPALLVGNDLLGHVVDGHRSHRARRAVARGVERDARELLAHLRDPGHALGQCERRDEQFGSVPYFSRTNERHASVYIASASGFEFQR